MSIPKISAVSFALLLVGRGLNSACADEDFGSLSAYVTLANDYRFRGISQNNNEIAEQGALNWSGPHGFYVSTWLSKVNFLNGTSIEADLCGGKNSDLDGTTINVEECYYGYPDRRAGLTATKSGFSETLFQLSHTVGQLTVTATAAQSPDLFGNAGSAWYAGGSAVWVLNDWVSVSSNVGHQWVNHTLPGYTHWDIGVVGTWRNFTLDARYVDTNLAPSACVTFTSGKRSWCSAGAIVNLTYNISSIP